MPNPHFDISIVQRSKGKSAVAGAAYQSGEKLFSEYDQTYKDYRNKHGMQGHWIIEMSEMIATANARSMCQHRSNSAAGKTGGYHPQP